MNSIFGIKFAQGGTHANKLYKRKRVSGLDPNRKNVDFWAN